MVQKWNGDHTDTNLRPVMLAKYILKWTTNRKYSFYDVTMAITTHFLWIICINLHKNCMCPYLSQIVGEKKDISKIEASYLSVWM